MITKVQKRDGRKVTFNIDKISHSIFKAAQAVGGTDFEMAELLAEKVANYLDDKYFENNIPTSQNIQDAVEKILIENEHSSTARAYIASRHERTKLKEKNSDIIKVTEKILNNSIFSPNKTIINLGKELLTKYNLINTLKPEYAKAHIDGDIYIHNLNDLTLSPNSFQIDLVNIFKNNNNLNMTINEYINLTLNIIKSISNDITGMQNISNFDYAMSIAVKNTYIHNHIENLSKAIELLTYEDNSKELALNIVKKIKNDFNLEPSLNDKNEYFIKEREELLNKFYLKTTDEIQRFTNKYTILETKENIYNAINEFAYEVSNNYNSIVSINYGLDTSIEGRLIITNLLDIIRNNNFEIKQIFKIKDGINYNKEDINYDIFKIACDIAIKKSCIYFSFLDASFNLNYYNINDINKEVAYIGDRTRIISNVFNKENEISTSRGNLGIVSINLPRVALKSNHNVDKFFELLEDNILLASDQLLERLKILSSKLKKNYSNLFQKNMWIDSEKININDKLENIIKNGTLSIGFIGLSEALIILTGKHHGENKESQELGIKIVSYMREKINILSNEYSLNFDLLGISSNKISDYFIKKDKEKFGIIKDITDKKFYTDSFHIPHYFNISPFEKIKLEAPYHNLTNGGHVTYVETNNTNVNKFEELIRCMKESNIGLGEIKIKNNNSKNNNKSNNKKAIFDDIELEKNNHTISTLDTSLNDIDSNIKINNLDKEIENIINSNMTNKI